MKIMLRGFAVECLIKAIWLKEGNKLCIDGRYLGVDRIKNQKLHEMISKLRISISKTERNVLRILSAVATSGGRYPVFVRYDSLEKDFGSGDLSFIQEWNESELEPAYHALKDRLIQIIEEEY